MAVRSIKVWNASASAWEGVGVEAPDFGAFVGASLFNAKGDLLTATANDTPAILTAGSNGQMLMADSSATAGLRYVDPPVNRNLIINGAMQVAQRGTSVTGITATGYYTADRWQHTANTTNIGAWTQSVEADGPSGSGLTKSLKMLCTTDRSSLSASDRLQVLTRMEGQDVQRIRKGTADALQLTVSFWVKSNVTGTYVLELFDTDNTRAVSATYSVSASATWERKTITFPADTTGTLNNDNDQSLVVGFWVLAGTNFTSGTLQTTWVSNTNANRAVGQTNLAAATNNYWQVTGVQLETGPVATPFEFEPYEATLRKCQRYYYLHASGALKVIGNGSNVTASAMYAAVHFPTTMRTAPSLSVTTGTNYYTFYRNSADDLFNSLTVGNATENGANVYNNSEISGTAGHAGLVTTYDAAASLAFSAEL